MHLKKAKRLVIKVGSSILIGDSGDVHKKWLDAFAQDIAKIKERGTEVIIVTSGAVALGRSVIGKVAGPLKLEEKQAAAACGQVMLVQAWRESLLKYKIQSAQILLTIDDSENRRRYLNARGTLETLLENNVIPIINENDTVATAELRFGDNDRLAARVAQMISADMLVLLSDIDGLYSANPNTDKNAQFIEEVPHITAEIEAMAGSAKSSVGSGGMITKIQAAKIAVAAGCHMLITLGKQMHPLQKFEDTARGTWFISSSTPKSARNHWISGSVAPAGVIIIDEGAEGALLKGKSLLPAGVKKIEGKFERGDAVLVKNPKGKALAKGLIAYSSEDAAKIIGHKSQEIEKILGFKGRNALIHRDDMVMS